MAVISGVFAGTGVGGFRRASNATYVDASGVLRTVGNDILRPAYDPVDLAYNGNLIEGASTNSIRNPRGEGAVVGSPGTMPTFWSVLSAAGLTRQIVGTGIEDGIPYVDIRNSGTSNATLFQIICEATTVGIPALSGQQWTSSVFLRLVGGSYTNFATTSGTCLELVFYSSAGGALVTGGSTSDPAPLPTSAPLRTQRYSVTFIPNNASIAYVNGCNIRFNIATASAIDFTIRIGAPQCELLTSSPVNYSGVFGNGWTQSNIAQTNFQPDPLGTSRAIFLTDNNVSATHFITHVSGTVANNQPLTFSVYVKDGGRRYMRFQIFDTSSTGNQMNGYYDVVAGTLSATATIAGVGTGLSAGIIPVGDGWFRAWITGTLSTTPDTTVSCRLFLYNIGSGGGTYADGTGLGLYLFGPQLEAASSPGPLVNLDATSVILPPAGSPAASSRAIDVLSPIQTTTFAGVTSTGQVAGVILADGIPAFGVAGVAAAGSPVEKADVPLSGVAATGAANPPRFDKTLTITGVATSGWVGGFSRASSAYYHDASGVLQSAGANLMRPWYDPVTNNNVGILIEPASTNYTRNPRSEGAVIGSAGTLPTNWSIPNGLGLTRTIVGTGTEDGIPYIDIRFNGTSTAAVFQMQTDTSTGIAAAPGQAWVTSAYIRLVAGTTTNFVAISLAQYFNDSGGTNLTIAGNNADAASLPTNAPLRTQRYVGAAFATNASTANTNGVGIRLVVTTSQPYDFTLRIGAPQTELVSSTPINVMPLFGNTWTNSQTAATSFQPDPVGTSRAIFVTDTAVSGGHFFQGISGTIPNNQPATFSVYLKDGGRRYCRPQLFDTTTSGNQTAFTVDLQTGTITANPSIGGLATGLSASIAAVGNGWYRVAVTATLSTTADTTMTVRLFLSNNSGTGTSYADGTGKGLYFWGAQLQTGSLSNYVSNDATTPMLPPVGSPGTSSRAADIMPDAVSIADISIGVASQTNVGSLVARISPPSVTGVTVAGQVGSVGEQISKTLAGVSASGGAGSLSIRVDETAATVGVSSSGATTDLTGNVQNSEIIVGVSAICAATNMLGGVYLRQTQATYFDSAGTLQLADPNVLRYGYDPVTLLPIGNLYEAASTNWVRNPRGENLTSTSFGVLPQNWIVTNTGNVLTWVVVGTGIEDGIPYTDIRYNGTTNGNFGINTESVSGIPIQYGQIWTVSAYLRVVAGTIPPPFTTGIGFYTYNSSGALATAYGPNQGQVGPTSAPLRTQRFIGMGQVGNAAAVYAGGARIGLSMAAGAVDFTLRIGAPSAELVSDNYAYPAMAAWTVSNTTYSYNQPDPFGQSRAMLVVDNNVSAPHHVYFLTFALLQLNQQNTFSFYVKDAGRRYLGIYFLDQVTQANSATVHLDLQTGTIVAGPTAAGAVTGISASITPVDTAPGWYRCAISATHSASTTPSTFICRIYLEQTPGSNANYIGTGVGVYLWGSQVQVGPLTDYINNEPTSVMLPPIGSPAVSSRGADILTQFIVITDQIFGVGGNGQAGSPSNRVDTGNISGVSATGQPGSLVPRESDIVAGVAGTSTAGILLDTISAVLPSMVANGASGSLIPSDAGKIIGVGGTSSAGITSVQDTITLAGASAIGGAGSLAIRVDDSASLTGLVTTGAVGNVAIRVDDTIAMTGVAGASGTGTIVSAITAFPTGVSAIGTVGIASIRVDDSATLVGLSSSGNVGGVTIRVDDTTALTGVASNGAATPLGGGTFSRASTATYLNSSGAMQLAPVNALRVTYDPAARVLIEPSSINNLANSLSTAPFSVTGRFQQTVTTNVGLYAPATVWMSIDTIGAPNDSNVAFYFTDVETIVGQAYVGSIWVWIPSSYTSSNKPYCNLDGGTTVAGSDADLSKRDQWQRIWKTVITNQGNQPIVLRMDSNLGDYICYTCFQLEPGSVPTSYIPTSGTPTTRAADVISTAGIPVIQDFPIGVAAIAGAGSFSVLAGTSATASVVGVISTGSAGSSRAKIDISLTGRSAAGQIGTVSVFAGTAATASATGVVASGSTGSFVTSIDLAINGIGGFGQCGTVRPNVAGNITSVQGQSQTGTFVPSGFGQLVGAVGSGQTGGLTARTTISVSGVATTGQVGSTAPREDGKLLGVAGSAAASSLTITDTVVLSGVAAAGAVGVPIGAGTLGGVASSGNIGSLQLAIADTLGGVAAFGNAGTLHTALVAAITGAEVAGRAGLPAPRYDLTSVLSGVASSSSLGTPIQAVQPTAFGVVAVGNSGSLALATTIVLHGAKADAVAGNPTVSASSLDFTSVNLSGLGTNATAGDLFATINTPVVTGVSCSGQIGVVIAANVPSISGVQTGGQAGGFTFISTVGILGASSAAGIGGCVPEVDIAALGVGSVGNVGVSATRIQQSITGTAGSGQAGNLSATAPVSLQGVGTAGQVDNLTKLTTVVIGGVESGTAGGNVTTATGLVQPITGVASQAQSAGVQIALAASFSGVVAVGQAGIASVIGVAQQPLVGIASPGQVGGLSDAMAVALIGNSTTTNLGNLSRASSVILTGVEAVAVTGDVIATIGFVQSIAGVASQAQLGVVQIAIAGSLSGAPAIGQSGNLSIARIEQQSILGVEAGTAVGDVTATATTGVAQPISGVASQAQCGDVQITSAASCSGALAIGQVGNLSVTGAEQQPLIGVESSSETGAFTFAVGGGLAGTVILGQAGTPRIAIEGTLSGVTATGQAASVPAIPGGTVAGVESEASTASLSVIIGAILTGAGAEGAAGAVQISGTNITTGASIEGVESAGEAGNLTIGKAAPQLRSGGGQTRFRHRLFSAPPPHETPQEALVRWRKLVDELLELPPRQATGTEQPEPDEAYAFITSLPIKPPVEPFEPTDPWMVLAAAEDAMLLGDADLLGEEEFLMGELLEIA